MPWYVKFDICQFIDKSSRFYTPSQVIGELNKHEIKPVDYGTPYEIGGYVLGIIYRLKADSQKEAWQEAKIIKNECIYSLFKNRKKIDWGFGWPNLMRCQVFKDKEKLSYEKLKKIKWGPKNRR